ncbi:indolepyruvate ferredoxin oxidoreductase family protein [Microbulbifer pacificus]|uniref:Indolepyruvate ferredoxin oxidoreductase family protein n=1 Tax=Microbulbifer pacificus TaxID=407164 RepID=A0AAU0N203_9GAMM|nr:indolepyruvate ferredoxin oxidoreductase family protein [Microbulbifer pacificus]WOX07012.1 indolepyruvate ferredoxin oxidoreductase family protein [Microbulbifer pacificus]
MSISQKVSLSDRLEKRSGKILISGVQALVRLMLLQAERDAAAGRKTGGFVSGYRGSPLGTLDSAFATAGRLTEERGIVVRPAVNEELAATAVAGTQQINQTSAARVEGVFSLWYGKGPGLDRASDALRHANTQGSSELGGVLLAVGDDHIAKSSTVVCSSDDVVAALNIPLFYPSDAAEVISFGLHGFAMSRHTGSYAALKIITEVADSTRAIDTDELDDQPVLPDIVVPDIGLHNRWPETPLEQETRQIKFRLPAVAAYVRANKLDRVVLKNQDSRIGLVAAGKSWLDLLEAFRLLGLDEGRLAELGIALYKPALVWPLEPEGLKNFARDLDTVLVVEEKGAFIENQIKSILYTEQTRPVVWGKYGEDGESLLPETADITPEAIAAIVGGVIATQLANESLAQRAESAESALHTMAELAIAPVVRKPFFCSGCPHNRSTVVPEGSRALAGIGCHGLAAYNRPFHGSFAQMGGEGIHWVGLAPFTDEKHIFANMGDGTYFHSGLLAIRQAVAANVNITFKLLYNSAVAMTGGQAVDGELSVSQLVDQVRAEGVDSVILSTDEPERYGAADPVRSRVERVEHRDDFEALQRELRERSGVSVIIYEQVCATEKRRLRKRGKIATPDTRVFINELVCEGCGDCSAKSNCLSIEPIETELGTKRRVNQSTCNMDYSCTTGFCPSFVSVKGGTLKRSQTDRSRLFSEVAIALPDSQNSAHERIVVAGVGGTGVVTIGALISMAAHITGKQVGILDQVGLAQKGGAVVSHVHVSSEPINALRIPAGEATLVIACDEVVGNSRDVMAAIQRDQTRVVANGDVSITGDFTQNRNAMPDADVLTERMKLRAGEENFAIYPFTRIAERMLGNAIASNLMMLGFAWQKGWLQLELSAFKEAVALNNTAVEMNLAAFTLGRQLAVDPQAVLQEAGVREDTEEISVDEIIERRAEFLTDYQDEKYAKRFRATVQRAADAEAQVGGDGSFSIAVAKSLFRLMAYKDEYEVARLYTDGRFMEDIKNTFDGPIEISFHLAPPMLANRDKATGHLRKRSYGSWMMSAFRLLAKGRRLRGTVMDPFGYTLERKTERRLIRDYESLIERLIAKLSKGKLDAATRIAEMAQEVRGYGHVKDRATAAYESQVRDAIENYEGRPTPEIIAIARSV